MVILEFFKLGNSKSETDQSFYCSYNFKLERLYAKIIEKKDNLFKFEYEIDGGKCRIVIFDHMGEEFPVFSDNGKIEHIILYFKEKHKGKKVILTEKNLPDRLWMQNEKGGWEEL